MTLETELVPEALAVPDARPVMFADKVRRTFGALSFQEARTLLEVTPERVGSVRRPGPEPYRILMFGSGALRGVGRRDHDLGLPGALGSRLAELTNHGVRIDVIVDTDPTSAASLIGLAGLRLRRYDAVIVVLGDEAASTRSAPSQWRGALVGLARVLMDATSQAAGLFVYDTARAVATLSETPPARALAAIDKQTEVTEELCGATARIAFRELRTAPGLRSATGGFADSTFADWADLIAGRLVPRLVEAQVAGEDESPRAYRNRPQDERFRQRALDSLRLRIGERNERLDREVQAAQRMFHVAVARVNVIDGAWQWSKAATSPAEPMPRDESFCRFTIESEGLTLINDTQKDPRTANSRWVTGPGAVRFYAARPLHSFDGFRIGALCVFDPTPRNFRPRDLDGLHDVAARIEHELWAEALRG